MKYLSKDQLLAVGAHELYADAFVLTGKLYDQAYVAHRNSGYGQASEKFNGKEINCTISNRCVMGRLRSDTTWRVCGKRVSQKQLMQAVCKVT